MNKCNKILTLLIAAITIGYFFLGREKVIISDLEWNCEALKCDLSFIVANRSLNNQQGEVIIRAYTNGKAQGRVIWEKALTVGVAPFERKRVKEKFMALTIDIVTLFPNFFKSPLHESLLKKAQERGLVKVRTHNLRDWTHDRRRTADDKPFGGGAGMVMKPEPIFACVEEIGRKAWTVLLDPQGEPMSQKLAQKLAKKKRLVLIAGHYEGVDQRVKDHLIDQEISVGDFITMGGEAPALCLIEAIVRLVPGVLGNAESIKHESFQSGILECPHYTRPREYRGWKVPEALVSGDHKELNAWRKKMAEQITKKKRPDLNKGKA